MKINPKLYKPAIRGESDKYSWNLYRVLNDRKAFDIRVYRFGWSPISGVCQPEDGELRIFFMGGHPRTWLDPSISVTRATVDGPKGIGCAVSFSDVHPNDIEKEDVTEWFFREYERIGRCLFQGDGSHEWININKNSRKCRYCGEHQRRTVETVKTVKRKDVWK